MFVTWTAVQRHEIWGVKQIEYSSEESWSGGSSWNIQQPICNNNGTLSSQSVTRGDPWGIKDVHHCLNCQYTLSPPSADMMSRFRHSAPLLRTHKTRTHTSYIGYGILMYANKLTSGQISLPHVIRKQNWKRILVHQPWPGLDRLAQVIG